MVLISVGTARLTFHMGEGQSPEIHAPPHPAERFPWMPRDEFFRDRDQYVYRWGSTIVQSLGEASEFKYRNNQGVARNTGILYLRAFFVSEYLKHLAKPLPQHAQEIPINIYPWYPLHDEHTGAITKPEYNLSDREIQEMPNAAEKLKIKGINILVNLNFWASQIDMIEDVAAEGLVEERITNDFTDRFKAAQFEKEEVNAELMMVEEMAHAFYYINLAGNPGDLLEWEKVQQSNAYYNHTHAPEGYQPSEEEFRSYLSNPIEQDADKWKAAFIKHHYPQISAIIDSTTK